MPYVSILLFFLTSFVFAADIPEGVDILSCDNGNLKVVATNQGFIFVLNHDQAKRQLELSPEYGRSYFEVAKIGDIPNLEFKGSKYMSYPYGRIFYVKKDRQDLVVESFKAAQVTGGAPLEQREKISDWKFYKCKYAKLVE
ncbi:MAG: hypothetical protein WCG27_09505 [Pseudomonadota bacterium]